MAGFLIAVVEQEATASHHWESVLASDEDLVLSTLSICEFLVYYFKRGQGDAARALIEQIRGLDHAHFVGVDETIAERAAGYRYGLGIPTVDSLILATFVEQGCDLVLSVDGHFAFAGERGVVKVEMLV